MAEHHHHTRLVLGVGELIEHGLQAAVVQALMVVDLRLVTEYLEQPAAGLAGTKRRRTVDDLRHELHLAQSLGDLLGLLKPLLRQRTVVIAVLTRDFGLRMTHQDQHVIVLLGFLRGLAHSACHCSPLSNVIGRAPSACPAASILSVTPRRSRRAAGRDRAAPYAVCGRRCRAAEDPPAAPRAPPGSGRRCR